MIVARTKINQFGLSLIEIVLLITLLTLVGGALTQLSVVSLKTADAARVRSTANELARQGIELARSKRDNDASAFFALTGYYSTDTSNNFVFVSATYTDPDSGKPPASDYQLSSPYQNFYRVVHFDTTSSDKTVVTVKVYYQQRGVYDNVVLQTILSNWR